MNMSLKLKIVTLVVSLLAVLWTITYVQNGKMDGKLEEVGLIPKRETSISLEMTSASAASDDLSQEAKKADSKERIIKVTRIPIKKDSETLTWCETRVKTIKTKSGIKIEQEGHDWVAYTPDKKMLNNVEFEKWLAKNCTLNIVDSRPPPFVPTKNDGLLDIDFINGESGKFEKTPNGYLSWDGLLFKSAQFDEAVDQLKKLAEAGNKK